MAINGNYVLRETTANLTRNITLTVASVLTVFVSLAILGSTVLVRQGAQNATRQFEGGVEFIVYVDADITPSELAAVKASLEDNPGVLRAPYVDAEATYKEFRRLFKGQETMLENVRKGEPLNEPLAQSPVFPPMVTRMIGIGEKTGSLEQLLDKIAEFYEEQVNATVKQLTSLIEPIMIAIMGLLVGTICLSVFLPIFELQKQLAAR